VAAIAATRPLRCFFAVDLGEEARRAAGALASALRGAPGGEGVRWVRAEALHVTLRFLGDTPPTKIPRLVRDVGAQVATVPSFTFALGDVQLFPSPRRPRVVALHVGPELPLSGLARAVEAGCIAAGFAPEKRGFRAHLTLGRIASGRAPARRESRDGRAREGAAAPSLDGVAPPPPATTDVREVVLYESRLGPAGSTYLPLERLPLGGSDHPQTALLED
jgi:2'-5' RNA ligase